MTENQLSIQLEMGKTYSAKEMATQMAKQSQCFVVTDEFSEPEGDFYFSTTCLARLDDVCEHILEFDHCSRDTREDDEIEYHFDKTNQKFTGAWYYRGGARNTLCYTSIAAYNVTLADAKKILAALKQSDREWEEEQEATINRGAYRIKK